jgi:hypothetical protein
VDRVDNCEMVIQLVSSEPREPFSQQVRLHDEDHLELEVTFDIFVQTTVEPRRSTGRGRDGMSMLNAVLK